MAFFFFVNLKNNKYPLRDRHSKLDWESLNASVLKISFAEHLVVPACAGSDSDRMATG